MLNSQIDNIKFADNECVALFRGDTLVYRKLPGILAGSFTEPGEYTFKYNGVDTPIELNSDLTFSKNVRKLTNCVSMFSNSVNLETITAFPTTKDVTNMSFMFNFCNNLYYIDFSNFDTSKVTTMQSMFSNCYALTSLDVSDFDMSNVTDMSNMFAGCYALTDLNVSGIDTSKVKTMFQAFTELRAIETLDLSDLNTESVTNMSTMFARCFNLKNLNISSFDTSKVTNMQNMFKECSSLTSLDISHFIFKDGVYLQRMFSDCTSLESINFGVKSFSKFTLNMFANCTSLTTVTGTASNIIVDLHLQYSSLAHDSVMFFINGLAEVEETKNIFLKTSVMNTLSDEEIALATSLGWTVLDSGN